MSSPKYKPGDRVVNERRRNIAGSIVKPAPVYPVVRWDDKAEDKRVRIEDVRPETADDIARREHDESMRAWSKDRPRVERIALQFQRPLSLGRPTCGPAAGENIPCSGALKTTLARLSLLMPIPNPSRRHGHQDSGFTPDRPHCKHVPLGA